MQILLNIWQTGRTARSLFHIVSLVSHCNNHNLWIPIQTYETNQPVSLLEGSLSACVHVPQRAKWPENFCCDVRDRVKFVA